MRHYLQTLDKKVRAVLAEVPTSRNSDITLTIAVWEKYHKESLIEQDGIRFVNVNRLFNLPREDHVKRVRARIQNVEHLYLPTDLNILYRRLRLSKEWREFLGFEKNWTDAQIAIIFNQKIGNLPKQKKKIYEYNAETNTYAEKWVEID